ncbi:hypothetical protein WOLCODRAFT_154043 [Wolfiporia cocos MD-104 SS10]|uniref:Uncharacterized protein n=1 Tax=Wolfiporia cocos (strain MD-104) TaxID=742152 RepID=A0A2H3JYK3_WOLCO|nr:hypothetical protein WOLCODRAFT_154043 [Wolfiporia cocos MD-104 SS10]
MVNSSVLTFDACASSRATRHCHNPLDARLEAKVAQWQEEDRCEREEEEWRLHGRRWDKDSMDIDDDESAVAEDFTDESGDVEGDSDSVKALKVCMVSLSPEPPSVDRTKQVFMQAAASGSISVQAIKIMTCLIVVDTNILPSSLSMFATLM